MYSKSYCHQSKNYISISFNMNKSVVTKFQIYFLKAKTSYFIKPKINDIVRRKAARAV